MLPGNEEKAFMYNILLEQYGCTFTDYSANALLDRHDRAEIVKISTVLLQRFSHLTGYT
jgi:hypothetical protein